MTRFAGKDVDRLLDHLLEQLQAVLGDKLVGFYVYGSLVWGDFDPEISDLDLLAVLAADLGDSELESLRAMHEALAQEFRAWEGRIEVQYVAADILRDFKHRTGRMATISPGEPLHFVEANREWLTNWHSVQERGVTLDGPPPRSLIEPITHEEFLQAVRDQVEMWRTHVTHTRGSRPYQSYAILCQCRAYLTLRGGRQVSKIEAAEWAKAEMPGEAALIESALAWRAEAGTPVADPEATYADAGSFVVKVIERIAAEGL